MKKYKLFVGCVMPQANALGIVDAEAEVLTMRCATTPTTLKVFNIAGNISADLLTIT